MPKRRRPAGRLSPECAAGHHNCCTDEELTEEFDCGCQCHDNAVLELVQFDDNDRGYVTFEQFADWLKNDEQRAQTRRLGLSPEEQAEGE